MNAILTIPPKFFADFSKRENTRRDSLSHPIRRSTMFRRLYDSRSNAIGRLSRSWFAGVGITGLMPRCRMYSSIQSARYPISPPSATGQAIGSPAPFKRQSSAPTSSVSNTVDSWAWPGVKWKCRGWPFESQRMWIFVEKPPRERPNA